MKPRAQRPAAGRKIPLGVLANDQYRLLFLGNSLSMLAFGMMQVVQGVVAFNLTGKNSAVGFVYLGQGIAMLLLSPVGGTLSDRISKKRLLTGAQFTIGAMFALIGALIITDLITIYLLAAVSLVLGCMYSMMGPTRQAWVGDLLQGPELAQGVALQQLMMNATRIIGPLLAGVMVATDAIGTAGSYLIMAGLFLAVVVLLALMAPTPPRPRPNRTSVGTDVLEGFRYIGRTPDVRLPALIFVGIVLSGFSYQTLMPGFLENTLNRPASNLGLLYGTTAAGGIVVTLVLAALRLRNPLLAMFGFGGALAGSLALLAAAPSFGVAMAVGALVGGSSSGFQMLNNVNLMQRADPAYFGRVMSMTMMAFGVNSIVAYPIGAIADRVGERATITGLGIACLTVVIAGIVAMRASPRVATPPRSVPAGRGTD